MNNSPLNAKVERGTAFLLGKLIGWKKYHRLVIVTRSRSGSNMLCSYLESHKECFMWRELFRKPQRLSPSIIHFLTHGRYLQKFKVVGYKVFYYHSVPENFWEETISDDNVKIIHLVRNNYLSTFVSQREATASARWQAFKENSDRPSRTKLKVDTDDMVSFLKENEKMILDMDRHLEGRSNVLRLSYEELVDGTGRGKVRDFLSDVLNPTGFGEPENKKQSNGQLSDRIENFEEVEEVLRKHNWGHFVVNAK